jgi:hypothetical protein
VRSVSSSFFNGSLIVCTRITHIIYELHNRFRNTRDGLDEKSAEDAEYVEWSSALLCIHLVQMLTRACQVVKMHAASVGELYQRTLPTKVQPPNQTVRSKAR